MSSIKKCEICNKEINENNVFNTKKTHGKCVNDKFSELLRGDSPIDYDLPDGDKTMTLFDKIKGMNEEELKDEILKIINWVTPSKKEVANNSDLIINILRRETK